MMSSCTLLAESYGFVCCVSNSSGVNGQFKDSVLMVQWMLVFMVQQIAVPFEYYLFHEHTGHETRLSKNFLWVELHGNDTPRNTLESRSYACTL